MYNREEASTRKAARSEVRMAKYDPRHSLTMVIPVQKGGESHKPPGAHEQIRTWMVEVGGGEEKVFTAVESECHLPFPWRHPWYSCG